VTVFNDRRSAALNELSGSTSDAVISASALNSIGLSGGQLPNRSDVQTKYPVNQTASVTNMR